MLITEAYRSQNRMLHDTNPAYGTSGGLVVDTVVAMAARLGTRSILDYGCGKRHLQSALGIGIANYDPAITGYDAPPQPADIVVCGDVLEHVEPECLDAVLADLVRVSNRAVLIVVATTPAKKFLPDGRNAHLIVNNAEWWYGGLQQHFRLSRFYVTDASCVFIGQSLRDTEEFPDFGDIGPPPQTKIITCKSAYTAEQRCSNIRSAMLRGLPSIKVLPAHKNTMVLACFGPSLKRTLGELSNDIANGGDLYTVSGAHSFLIDRGFKPTGHVEVDPRPIASKRFGRPNSEVAYFLSSACSREMLNAVAGFETWLFHVDSFAEEARLISSMSPGEFLVSAGSNVGMAALAVGSVLGYRRFIIHGMDCSFEISDDFLYWPRDKQMPPSLRREVNFHAGAHPHEDQDMYRVWVGNRAFLSSPQMFQGAQDFMLWKAQRPSYRYILRGDGFLQNLVPFLKRQSREKKEALNAAENIHRLRPPPASIPDSVGSLDYKARIKAGLYNSARARDAAA